MGKTVTFLQLSDEFGGTRFGPFDQVEIRLGCDPESNDITLPEALGVHTEHVKVLKQQDDSFILAPVERAAAIYFFRGGSGRSKQVQAPMACRGGDAFALVTPEGPRFFLQVEQDPKAIKEAAEEAEGPGLSFANNRVSTGSLWKEIKRRGFAAVFATKLGNWWMTAWRMISTGQLFSPVYIVGGLMMFSGWFLAMGGCVGTFNMSRGQSSMRDDLRQCKDQLGGEEDEDGNYSDPTVAGLTVKALNDRDWSPSIKDDSDLADAYAKGVIKVFNDKGRYANHYKKKSGDFNKFKSALEATGLDEGFVRVLAYQAAEPGFDREWNQIYNSDSKTVCARGPAGLTYQMAFNLGLTTVQVDAYGDRMLAETNDVDLQRRELDATLRKADIDPEYRSDLIQVAGLDQGSGNCIYLDGDDDRTEVSEIASQIAKKFGASSKEVPNVGQDYWISSRLVRFFALDFSQYEFEKGAIFAPSKTPSMNFAIKEDVIPESHKNWAIKQAGTLMGRAAAVPCLARLDKEVDPVPDWFIKEPTNLGTCGILKMYADYGVLK